MVVYPVGDKVVCEPQREISSRQHPQRLFSNALTEVLAGFVVESPTGTADKEWVSAFDTTGSTPSGVTSRVFHGYP